LGTLVRKGWEKKRKKQSGILQNHFKSKDVWEKKSRGGPTRREGTKRHEKEG